MGVRKTLKEKLKSVFVLIYEHLVVPTFEESDGIFVLGLVLLLQTNFYFLTSHF